MADPWRAVHGHRLIQAGTTLFLVALIVGLAVPVTASYIMCAVIAAPALIKLGVPDFAAHMFIFYYAVLSEVSPPTALSPFAAAAITGGDPYKTTLQSWKYTMPAFLVPFAFVLEPNGVGLLLHLPKGGSWIEVALLAAQSAAGIAILGIALQGWLFKRSTALETVTFLLAGVMLMFPSLFAGLVAGFALPDGPWIAGLGLTFAAMAAAAQRARNSRAA